MTTAFVAGATGYTGRAVVAELRARGLTTWAHVRPDSPRLAEWTQRFEAQGASVDTTPWTTEAMTARFAALRPDLVFALLGTTRSRIRHEGPSSDYEAVDYGMTATLLDAAVPVKARFVYLSALGASAMSSSAYMAVRGRIEDRLRESGLSWIAARPALITGPDRDESRPGERAAAAVVAGLLSVTSALGARKLAAKWGSLTKEELARGLVRVALDPSVVGVVEAAALRS